MTSKIDRALLCASVALFACATSASAQTITGTVDTSAANSATNQSTDGTTYYNAPYGGTLPAAPVSVGSFDFTVPNGSVVSGATISGDFGSNALGSGTAAVDLFVNSVEVARCDSVCEAATQSNDVAWSFTFSASQLGAFADGSVVLSAVQQESDGAQIVLDPTSVSLTLSAVPEPAGLPTLLLGFPLVALGLRRRALSRQA